MSCPASPNKQHQPVPIYKTVMFNGKPVQVIAYYKCTYCGCVL